MIKKRLLALLLGWSISILGMEPQSYLELLPQDLKRELILFTTSLQDIQTFKELQEKLGEIQQRAAYFKGLSSLIQAINNLQQQLELIKTASYTNALAALQALSNDKELEFLFNNPNFNRILTSVLWQQNLFLKNPENIAKELNTSGALEWLKQLEFLKTAEKGDVKAIKDFLDKGIDINAKDNDGWTALMYAAIGHKDIAELLLAHRANVNAKDNKGNTALWFAAEKGRKEIVEMLLKASADVNAKNVYGQTALMNAASRGYKDIVQMLIAKGADVNAKDKYGGTALRYAALYGHKDIVQMLIKSGANVNAQDEYGYTALMITTQCGYKEIVELLKRHGAK